MERTAVFRSCEWGDNCKINDNFAFVVIKLRYSVFLRKSIVILALLFIMANINEKIERIE
jgi:hypothetical protein